MSNNYKWVLTATLIATLSASVHAGYITTIPPGEDNAPDVIYKTDNVTGPMQTNDWWSNVAWQDFSNAAYPHPLAMQHEEAGLRIYYPGNRIYENSTYTSASINDIHDFTVGHSNSSSFSAANVDSFSDWFVTTKYENGSNSITASFGHGSPYVYFLFEGGNPELSFYTVPQVWYGDESSSVLGITMEGAHYALYGPTGSTWEGINSTTLTNLLEDGQNYFSVAVLPDASEETLLAFQEYAYSFVTDTKVDWSYNSDSSEVTSTFTYTTEAKEGEQTGTIMSLYPHQWRNSSDALLDYTYPSIRGTMKTTAGSSFSTTMTFSGLLPALPDAGSYDINTLASFVDEAEAENYDKTNVDTYWIGKRLGKLAVLAPIADQVGDSVAATQFRDEIKEILEEWFTATNADGSDKSSLVFYYNENWGTLIGYPDSYGSSYELNDHHFHYGYFIKAAAEIARVDPDWATEWGEMVELLIRDIANKDRDDDMFPFMRNFDPYEGHSWASGESPFADGNNNESSSEGMNAWAGIIQWAELTNNTELRDFAIYLYTTEMNGINEYWFDVTDENFPESYTASTASMVWGGKTVGNAVWWSGNTEEIHGINWLPFTAGSLYLTHYPDYAQFNYETLVSENGGSDEFDLWYDLILMYRAISDADGAMEQFSEQAADISPETGNSKANIYHWIGNLQALGTIDNSITADYPFYGVFSKGEVTTYVVYNMSDDDITVTFSDGYTTTVPSHNFAINESVSDGLPEEDPSDGEPTDDEPTDGEPTDDDPTDGEPTDDDPSDGQPTDDEPTDGEPTDEEPTDGEPTDDEPTDGEPTDDEPTDDEPTDSEPTEGDALAVNLYLLNDNNQNLLSLTSGSNESEVVITGNTGEPIVFEYPLLTADYNGGELAYNLCFDTTEGSVGTAPKLTVSYDFDGDGNIDRTETAGYFALDPIDDNWECFSQDRATLEVTGDDYQDFTQGSVTVSIWEALSEPNSTEVKVNAATNPSVFNMPYTLTQVAESSSVSILYLLQQDGIATLADTIGSSASGLTISGLSSEPIIFEYQIDNADYDGSEVSYSLCFDTLENTIATAPEMSISYDFDGDGEWDRVETAGYFALNPIPNNWECFTQDNFPVQVSGENYQSFTSGKVQVAIWQALGEAGTTQVKVNAGSNASFINLPYASQEQESDSESESDTQQPEQEPETSSDESTSLYLGENTLSLQVADSESALTITGDNSAPITFDYQGISAAYNGQTLNYNICLDTLAFTIATAPKLSVSYDFDGDGEWDRVETAGYFALDPIHNSWECFTQASFAVSGQDYQDFSNGSIQVAIWQELGDAGTTQVKVNAAEQASMIEVPYFIEAQSTNLLSSETLSESLLRNQRSYSF